MHAEESAIAMAHAYFKVTGKPQLSLFTAPSACSMALWVYNAWCDRAPSWSGRHRPRRPPSARRRADDPLRAGHQRARP